MRVLYVNHTAEVSGGEHSLLSLLGALPDAYEPLLATPEGPLRAAAEAAGIATRRITPVAGSLRLHPLHTPRALMALGAAAVQVRRLAARERAALVHANSIRAGLALRGLRGRAPARIVHVRDCLAPGRVSETTLRVLSAGSTIVLANSHHTARSVLAAAPRAHVEVAYSPVDLARFDPARIDRAAARARLGAAGEREMVLGVVAQLTPWKGQDTAIRALEMVCARGVDAHLLLVGSAKFLARSARYDNDAYAAALRGLVDAAGVSDRVSWLGEREDVPELLRALDALLLPSTEEPFGRVVVEAMAMGTPVLATRVGGPAEIVSDEENGLLLPPREPAAWAAAIERLADSEELMSRLRTAGRERARAFGLEHHLATVLEVYERARGPLQSR